MVEPKQKLDTDRAEGKSLMFISGKLELTGWLSLPPTDAARLHSLQSHLGVTSTVPREGAFDMMTRFGMKPSVC